MFSISKVNNIAHKEWKVLFHSPSAYGILLIYTFVLPIFFIILGRFIESNTATLRNYFALMPYFFVILIPLLTMGLWAEERQKGSIELLYALPCSLWEFVMGKATMVKYFILLMMGLSLPLILMSLSLGEFELGSVFLQYFGTYILANTCGSIGLFSSSLTKSQIIAFLLSFILILLFMFMGPLSSIFFPQTWIASVLNFFSLQYRFNSFVKGVLDTRDLLFFFWTIILFNYLTYQVLYFRKWK